MMLQRLPGLPKLGKNRLHSVPELRTMVHLAQMSEFMRDDVVNNGQRKVNQPPVEANLSIARTTTPPRRGGRKPISPIRNPELLGVHNKTLTENPLRLVLQPPLHAILDLLRISLRRQRQREHIPRSIVHKLTIRSRK